MKVIKVGFFDFFSKVFYILLSIRDFMENAKIATFITFAEKVQEVSNGKEN